MLKVSDVGPCYNLKRATESSLWGKGTSLNEYHVDRWDNGICSRASCAGVRSPVAADRSGLLCLRQQIGRACVRAWRTTRLPPSWGQDLIRKSCWWLQISRRPLQELMEETKRNVYLFVLNELFWSKALRGPRKTGRREINANISFQKVNEAVLWLMIANNNVVELLL